MLSTSVFHSITFPFILLAMVQFPAYGIFLGMANSKRVLIPVACALLAIHALAIGSNYAVVYYALHSPSRRLEEAVRHGDVQTVKNMLENGADPNTHLHSGASLLMLACNQGHIEVARLLVEKGADVNYIYPNMHDTALFAAVLHGREDIVQFLLSNGADTGVRDRWGNTALESGKLWRQDRMKRSEREKEKYTPEQRARDERIISLLEAADKDQKRP
jgi:hypothetical protein